MVVYCAGAGTLLNRRAGPLPISFGSEMFSPRFSPDVASSGEMTVMATINLYYASQGHAINNGWPHGKRSVFFVFACVISRPTDTLFVSDLWLFTPFVSVSTAIHLAANELLGIWDIS